MSDKMVTSVGLEVIRIGGLEMIRIGLTRLIPVDLLLSSRLDVYQVMANAITVELSGYLLGENLPERTIRHPASWWEALKERWFFAWMKRRWPVQWKEYHIQARLLYPDFRPKLPERPHFIDIQMFSEMTS